MAKKLASPLFLFVMLILGLGALFYVFPGLRIYIPFATESGTINKVEESATATRSVVRQLCDGFSKTIYSNFGWSVDSDIINLCDAGDLRPAKAYFPLDALPRGGEPYEDSIEILMVANLISRDFGASWPFQVQAVTPPKPEDYLLFNAGTEREIVTSGRTFLVKLKEINREPTKDGAPYFSYHFIVNEK